jgi:hypothetical protein
MIIRIIKMGNVKLKSNIRKDKEGDDETEEQIFAIAHTPTRREELEKRMRERNFGDYSDIQLMLKNVGGTIVSQTTHLPQGDKETLTVDELNRQREQRNVSRNRSANTTYYWH